MAKKASKSFEGNVLKIEFDGGQVVTLDVNALKPEIIERLVRHGVSQKVGDSYAGCETAQECFDAASAVVKDLLDGNWSTRVAAGGPKATQLAEALARATGKALTDAITVLDGMDDDAKSNLRKHPVVKAKLAELKAEKAIANAEKAAGDADGADLSSLI